MNEEPSPAEYSPVQLEALVEKAKAAPTKREALEILQPVIDANPAPASPTLLPSIMRARMLRFTLTDGHPPEAKDELFRELLEFADAHEGREGRRQAAKLRLALSNSLYLMSRPGASDEMRQEIVELFSEDRDSPIRLAVARARSDYALARPDPEERQALLADIVRDYFDSDNADICSLVIDLAKQVYLEMKDPALRQAYCLDIVNRYGYIPDAIRPQALSFFFREKRRHYGDVRDRRREIETELEKHARRFTVNSFSTILALLEDKAEVLELDRAGTIGIFREFAETSSQALSAQLLYHVAMVEGFPPGALPSIVERFFKSDDPVAYSIVARILTETAKAGDRSEEFLKQLDDFITLRGRSLIPPIRGSLLLVKAETTDDIDTRLTMFNRVLSLPDEEGKDRQLLLAAPPVYERPRFLAALRKYDLTGNVDVAVDYLESLLERTGDVNVVLSDSAGLMKLAVDDEDLDGMIDFVDPLRERSDAGAHYVLLTLIAEAAVAEEAARSKAAFLKALDFYEKKYRDDMLIFPTEIADRLPALAGNDVEKKAFLDRLLALCRENQNASEDASRCAARLSAELDRLEGGGAK